MSTAVKHRMKPVMIQNHKGNKKQYFFCARCPPLKNTKYFGQLPLILNQGQIVNFSFHLSLRDANRDSSPTETNYERLLAS